MHSRRQHYHPVSPRGHPLSPYYAVGNSNPTDKSRQIQKVKPSSSRPSLLSKSPKGISLSKNIKKTFQQFYFGIVEANPQPLQTSSRTPPIPRQTTTLRFLKPAPLKSKSQVNYLFVNYSPPVVFDQQVSISTLQKKSRESNLLTDLSYYLGPNKQSRMLSTAMSDGSFKNSRCQSQSGLRSHLLCPIKPTSAVVYKHAQQPQSKKVKETTGASLRRGPIYQSVYVQSNVLDEYLSRNNRKN